jgi:hypothetical protein
MAECLPGKHKVLISNTRTTIKKKKKKKVSWYQWLMPAILETVGTKISRIKV